MRTLRQLSLFAFAIGLGVTAVGPSPALAESTALCSADQNPCLESNRAAYIHLVDPATELLNAIVFVKCETLISGEVLSAGAPQLIHTKLSFSGCTGGGMPCEVKEISSSGFLRILKTAKELGEVAASGIEVSVKCGFFIQCTYGVEGLLGHFLGALEATNGHITYSKTTVKKIKGILCPATTLLDALFESLKAVYLAGEYQGSSISTAICTVDETPCPLAHQATSVHFVDPAEEFLTSSGNIKCEALFKGDVLALGAPQIIHGNLTYFACKTGETSCEVKEVSPEALLGVSRRSAELIEVINSSFEVLASCGKIIHCVYNAEGLTGRFLGALSATQGHINFNDAVLKSASGTLCPKTTQLDELLQSLSALYVGS